ncbi:DNA-binding protein [Rhodobacteraceae bacterium CH30]|nr:DNA-binding protein [Rhodobacteraceae bacterium CH30]
MLTTLLTTSELANLLGLAVQTIYNRRASGSGDALPPAILLGGRVRYHLSDVEQWLQNQYEHLPAMQEANITKPSAPAKRGRPSKAEAIRKRNQCQPSR